MTILLSTPDVDCVIEEENLMPGSAISLKWIFLASRLSLLTEKGENLAVVSLCMLSALSGSYCDIKALFLTSQGVFQTPP